MPKKRSHPKNQVDASHQNKQSADKVAGKPNQQIEPANLLQLAREDPHSLPPGAILQLQGLVGNRAVSQLLAGRKSAASQTVPPVQRALDFEPTNWKSTKAINWVKGQDHPDHDNVLMYKGSGPDKLWVKTDEVPAETIAASNLINAAAGVRHRSVPR